jgi:hypothetical protein
VIYIFASVIAALVVSNLVVLWFYFNLRGEREMPTPAAIKLKRRLSKLPAEARPMWAEQVLGETGRAFSMWRGSGERAYLDEARTGAYALHSLFTAMQPRD